MSRAAITTVAIACALVVGVFLLIRDEGDSSPEKEASNAALSDAMAIGSPEAEAELERRSQELEEEANRKGATASSRESERLDKRSDRLDELNWRAFDEQFRRTPFDRAIDALPLRTPPLDVLQWVTNSPPDKLPTKAARERFYRMSPRERAAAVRRFYRSGPKKLYARVKRERWYRMSVREREAAVKAFYRDAVPFFKKAGIKDFVLVVTPWGQTVKDLPELAVGRGGSASLTPLGREQPESGV